MDGGMGLQMDGWTYRWVDELKVDGSVYGLGDEWIHAWIGRWTDSKMAR